MHQTVMLLMNRDLTGYELREAYWFEPVHSETRIIPAFDRHTGKIIVCGSWRERDRIRTIFAPHTTIETRSLFILLDTRRMIGYNLQFAFSVENVRTPILDVLSERTLSELERDPSRIEWKNHL